MEKLILNDINFEIYNDTLKKIDSMWFRNKSYYGILFHWLKNKNNNKNITNYLLKQNIKTVGIYGAGNLGELLFDELKNDDEISIKCIIDRDCSNGNFLNTPIIQMEQLKENYDVDCIIVTPIYAFEEINKDLKNIGIKNVIGIDDIVFNIYEN